MKNITGKFIEYLRKKNTKIAKKCLKALNRDIVVIWQDNFSIVLEPVNRFVKIPNYLYDQFSKFKKTMEV